MIHVTEEHADYVLRANGRCRDCADNEGMCPMSGLPCDPQKARDVVNYVLSTLMYGVNNKMIPGLIEKETS